MIPQTERVRTMEDVRAILTGSQTLDFDGMDREATCDRVGLTLVRLAYDRLGERDKGLIKRFLEKITGLSRAQTSVCWRERTRVWTTCPGPQRGRCCGASTWSTEMIVSSSWRVCRTDTCTT